MRKPLLALSLAFSTGLGAIPVADALAAVPAAGQGTGRSTVNYTNPSYNSPVAPPARRTPNAVSGAQIISTALKYIGYPYTATGNSPSTGFSCIGFVSFVYRSNGISLPGDLGGAIAFAQPIPFNSLLPGDILYFQNTVWSGLSHAAIYLGGGKFIHAEYYGYGVRISSFNNDVKDGNYWTQHYLGANRPWTGAAVAPIVPAPAVPSNGPALGAAAAAVPATTAAKVVGGTSAVVSVGQLNVRTTPSKASVVQTIVSQGATVTVIGHRKGWYKVQLQDGTIGWVVAEGIGMGSTQAPPTTQVAQVVQPTVGTPTVPARQGAPVQHHGSMTSKVDGLRVHASPGLNSAVVTSVGRGQRAQVIGHSGNWVKIRLADGTEGWVMKTLAKVHGRARQSATAPVAATYVRKPAAAPGRAATVAMNVRSGPSLSQSVVAVVPAGSRYHVIGWSGNWARVQLADGTTGWVSGALAGRTTAPQSSYHRQFRASSQHGGHGSVLSAGVRLHTGTGVNSPVVGLAAAGTHVRVLGYSRGWVLIRLPGGATGYVLGSYVH